MTDNINLLSQIEAFLYTEADMLDHKEYDDWLNLWSETGMYIIPVDHSNKDYKNALNLAYDDAKMRRMRIDRLQSGEAVSTHDAGVTVRTLSRFRILDEVDGLIRIRCAYCLFENNRAGVRIFPADLQYKLRKDGGSFKIEEKIVNVMKSDEHLTTISYLF
jgi:3-phenylpropionate/cinnamic acid dioxygenase small subunit